MDDFTKIRTALMENGFDDYPASMLAEHLSDWGWENIKEVLNSIE